MQAWVMLSRVAMRYESESRVWSTAARIVSDRVRALPEFSKFRGSLVRDAVALCRGKTVAEMRELGGFSSVLQKLIEALPESSDANVGSKLLHCSVRSELRLDVPSMRGEVQRRLALDCTCYLECRADSHSGRWHQHESEPCSVHPNAPMVG